MRSRRFSADASPTRVTCRVWIALTGRFSSGGFSVRPSSYQSTDDRGETAAVQRPIADTQRPDVRHRVGGVDMDAARIGWGVGIFGVYAIAVEHRPTARARDSPPCRDGTHADCGVTQTRTPGGDAAVAVVRRALSRRR